MTAHATTPSEAAVEAAAEAILHKRTGSTSFPSIYSHGIYRAESRAALSAALPIIREEIAQEVEALIPTGVTTDSPSSALRRAARIVRGELA